MDELFGSRFDGKGFDLHDTSVLAATPEHLIRNEAEGRLSKACNMADLDRVQVLNATDAECVLDTHMKLNLEQRWSHRL